MHVYERLATAVAARIAADVPAFEGRTYVNGALGWNRKDYPMCLVAIGRSIVDTARTGTGRRTGRVQTRAIEMIVEIVASSTKTEGAAAELVTTLTSLAGAVETSLVGFNDVPVEDLDLAKDGGIEGVESRGELHLRGRQALTYAVTIQTIEGRPDAFLEELY